MLQPHRLEDEEDEDEEHFLHLHFFLCFLHFPHLLFEELEDDEHFLHLHFFEEEEEEEEQSELLELEESHELEDEEEQLKLDELGLPDVQSSLQQRCFQSFDDGLDSQVKFGQQSESDDEELDTEE